MFWWWNIGGNVGIWARASVVLAICVIWVLDSSALCCVEADTAITYWVTPCLHHFLLNQVSPVRNLFMFNSQRILLPADCTNTFIFICFDMPDNENSNDRKLFNFCYFVTSYMVVIYNECLQPMKDLMLKTSMRRRGLELGLWSRKQSMPPPSSGIRWQERVGKVVKSCLLKSRMCMMQRSCRLWMLSVKHLYWRSYCLQSTMIIIWCSGVFFFCSTISFVDECLWFSFTTWL